MNKKIFVSALLACVATLGMNAQQPTGQELNKEITLEKDFVPVEKKVTKKNTLPRVKKVTPPAKTTLDYSGTPVTIEVPTTIPTLDPYGYRTHHNFSDKRGYLEVGGGMAANFTGSAGYRFVDIDSTRAGVWVQHNSTWAGKNRSPVIFIDADRSKQLFNDNRAGLYFAHSFNAGTLALDAGIHFDSFNYYGAFKQDDVAFYDSEKKQSFLEFALNAGWDARACIGDYELSYHARVGFEHAGYDFAFNPVPMAMKGAKEGVFNFVVGGSYDLDGYGTISLDLKGQNRQFKGAYSVENSVVNPVSDFNNFLFTISPRYKWENEIFRAEAGADFILGRMVTGRTAEGEPLDGSKFHVAPFVKIDVDFMDGATIFVDLKGGNTSNTLSQMAALDRYASPMGLGFDTWRPIDGEAGFKIGPFGGFSAKLFAGYCIAKGELVHYSIGQPIDVNTPMSRVINQYRGFKMRGFKAGAELNYKYRSLVEADAAVTYAPGGDDFAAEWLKGCALGLDGARFVSKLNVKITPLRQLAVNIGMDYRGQRRTVYYGIPTWSSSTDGPNVNMYNKMDDLFNLHVGASWRFDKVVTVWAKADNLLNRRYDILPYQGAQGINAMAGVSLVF